jgi:hypothetical protein
MSRGGRGDRDPAVQALLDKQAIHEATLRYLRGTDRCDAALIASAYHPDAIDEHGTHHYTGETVGPSIADRLRETTSVCLHHITNQLIRLDGDRAGCETYFVAWIVEAGADGEHVLEAQGRYLDRFECRDGEWRIAHRVVVTDIARSSPLAVDGSMTTLAVAARGRGRRDRSDPSYDVLGDLAR